MAKKKPTFPEPLCSTCPHHTILGNAIFGTRVCMGVKSKKGKRFRSSDPKYKPPKWCPKRISPRICRIYRLAARSRRSWRRTAASVMILKLWTGIL